MASSGSGPSPTPLPPPYMAVDPAAILAEGGGSVTPAADEVTPPSVSARLLDETDEAAAAATRSTTVDWRLAWATEPVQPLFRMELVGRRRACPLDDNDSVRLFPTSRSLVVCCWVSAAAASVTSEMQRAGGGPRLGGETETRSVSVAADAPDVLLVMPRGVALGKTTLVMDGVLLSFLVVGVPDDNDIVVVPLPPPPQQLRRFGR